MAQPRRKRTDVPLPKMYRSAGWGFVQDPQDSYTPQEAFEKVMLYAKRLDQELGIQTPERNLHTIDALLIWIERFEKAFQPEDGDA